MAAECSPGHKPGSGMSTHFQARVAGDRGQFSRCVRPEESVAPPGLIDFFYSRFPRAHARGYILPLAYASSLTLFILDETCENL
jgi:hypothetical protein